MTSGLSLANDKFQCQAVNCQQDKDARLQCSRCFAAALVGGTYCSLVCQKEHWAEHKPYCEEIRAVFESLPPEVRPVNRTLLRWITKTWQMSTEVGISALDLVNFPENAAKFYVLFELLCTTKEVSVVDIKIRNILELPAMTQAVRVEQDQEARSITLSALAYVVCFTPMTKSQDSLTLLPDSALPGRIMPIRYGAGELHIRRLWGMPTLNWRERFMAYAGGRDVPPENLQASPVALRQPFCLESDRVNMTGYITPHFDALKAAYLETMVRVGRSAKDHVLLVYIAKAADYVLTGSFEAISAAHYAIEDNLPVVHETRKHFGAARPLIIVNVVRSAFSTSPPIVITADMIACCDRMELSKRDETEWKRTLLSKMNGRKLVNSAPEEASRDRGFNAHYELAHNVYAGC